jgi:hypothetical protein
MSADADPADGKRLKYSFRQMRSPHRGPGSGFDIRAHRALTLRKRAVYHPRTL